MTSHTLWLLVVLCSGLLKRERALLQLGEFARAVALERGFEARIV